MEGCEKKAPVFIEWKTFSKRNRFWSRFWGTTPPKEKHKTINYFPIYDPRLWTILGVMRYMWATNRIHKHNNIHLLGGSIRNLQLFKASLLQTWHNNY